MLFAKISNAPIDESFLCSSSALYSWSSWVWKFVKLQKILQRITIKMLTFKLTLLCLLNLGHTEEIFTFYRGKSLKESSHTFQITVEPINAHHHRHCAMRCYSEPLCLAAFFEGELNLCWLYSNINGTTTGGEGDFAMVKKEFGIRGFILSFIKHQIVTQL